MNIEEIKRVNVVKSDFGNENSEVWTLSEDENTVGWETDSGTDGYGLSKEKAEYYAKCINEYPRLIQELEKAQQENEQLRSPTVEKMEYQKGTLDMTLSGHNAMNIMNMLVDIFESNGGKNFLTMTMEAPKREKRYEITITNLNGELSSGEKMNQLVQENKRYREAFEEIKEVDYCPMQILDIIDTILKPEEV